MTNSMDHVATEAPPGRHDRFDDGTGSSARLFFENVTHRIGAKSILSDISLSAEPGEILCLLGPSGSGKTTLLRLAAGIERQTGGRIVLNGREIAGPGLFVPPEKRGVGLMFQDFALFPHKSILDNVRFGLAALPRAASRQEAIRALDRVGLAEVADDYPHILSGGQQQRVALARALAPRPTVLLMDEPFSGLDSRLKDAIRTDTLSALRDSGSTAIVVTHDAEEAMRMGDRIALLREGRLVQVGTAEELYRRPANLFAAGFFSELNVIPGEVIGGRVMTALGAVASSPLSSGTAMTIALRLTGLRLATDAAGVAGRIVERRFLGAEDLVTIAVDGIHMPLRSRLRAGQLDPGQRDVFVSVDLRDVIVFERAENDA